MHGNDYRHVALPTVCLAYDSEQDFTQGCGWQEGEGSGKWVKNLHLGPVRCRLNPHFEAPIFSAISWKWTQIYISNTKFWSGATGKPLAPFTVVRIYRFLFFTRKYSEHSKMTAVAR